MKHRFKIIIILTFLAIFALGLFYIFFGQEYVYAKKYANRLLEYKLPEKTKVIEQDFDYGVLYGGGPWGSGGRPTLAAYKRISTELSEKEIFEHYNKNDFEIYFEGTEKLKKNSNNQIWYEGYLKSEDVLSSEENSEEPIEVIIQYRTEFSYPFFMDLY
ncbi:hypothetical protein E2R51_12335 [Jeotgalibacillus sp. S-D1]|uniref:hypothetical protein n=1 Tax=Jeotgalibacillus sp. S-D1 TaxID=2552189 RepID=UPI0010596AE0|nr:hypothetical protein [Jeotgalibacillus sp. S-D1]TDL31996.1 hypothetical protein E2R51_12335 [Jeotgalibacillus sp. S-D1]